MNQASHAEQTQTFTPVIVRDPTSPTAQKGKSGSGMLSRLETIREMLSTIESVTLAGQRHTMGKIIAFFEEVVANGHAGVVGHPRFILAGLLSQLGHEGARPFPDVPRFAQRAKDVLTLLDDLV